MHRPPAEKSCSSSLRWIPPNALPGERAAEDYERQVSAAVASDPEVKAFVERLENAMDEVASEEEMTQNLPSADTIARDFQRFLRQQRP